MVKAFVAILMGSDSDLPVMRTTFDTLRKLGIKAEIKVTSAHRTPTETHAYVKDAESRGCAIFICAAGLAAHLAGAVAGLTVKPVIGVPLEGGVMGGLDALLSTVQMPGGVPVATVAVGKAGAKNAAYLAAQMLAISDPEIAAKVLQDRKDNAAAVVQKDRDLQASLNAG